MLIDNFMLVSEGACARRRPSRSSRSGYPARNPDQNMADLRAMVACQRERRAVSWSMVAHFGLDTVLAYMRHVQDNAEESVRRVIEVLRDGEFAYEMDNGARDPVRITIDHANRSATIDFTGTSRQLDNNFNAPSRGYHVGRDVRLPHAGQRRHSAECRLPEAAQGDLPRDAC